MGSKAQRDNSEKSNSNTWAVAAGIACGLVGAAAGAIGYHYLAEKEKEELHSSSTCSKRYSDGTCAICQSGTEEILLLPCGHEYHKACVLEMKEKGTMFCPKCRQKIPEDILQPTEVNT